MYMEIQDTIESLIKDLQWICSNKCDSVSSFLCVKCIVTMTIRMLKNRRNKSFSFRDFDLLLKLRSHIREYKFEEPKHTNIIINIEYLLRHMPIGKRR